MNKKEKEKEIAMVQRAVLAAVAYTLAVIGLSLGWFRLLDCIGAPSGLWQPLSFCGLLVVVALVWLEILKRRSK